MHRLAAVLLIVPALAAAESYVGSDGRPVTLVPATDRAAVHGDVPGLIAAAAALADHGVVAIEPLNARAGWADLVLAPGADPSAAAAAAIRRGLADRAGAVFPAGRGESLRLDRQFHVKLRRPGPLPPLPGLDLAVVRAWRDGSVLARADGPDAALAACRALARHPAVAWAVPDFLVRFEPHGMPGDPWADRQWSLAQVAAPAAWEATKGSADVLVAVVDTGVDWKHPDLQADARMRPGVDTLDDDGDPWPGTKAVHAHGTHSAGIALAAHDNGTGIAGMCPECDWMGVRFMEGFSYIEQLSTASTALRAAADAGAWVIGNSWGIYPENKASPGHAGVDMAPILDAARYAATAGRGGLGAIVVFSTGNLGREVAPDDPAALPEVVAVGAVTADDRWATYSSYGPSVSLVAPGGSANPKEPLLATLDTRGADGANKADGIHWTSAQLVEVKHADQPEADPTGDTTLYFNGTSAAVPVVSGVAALVLSLAPGLTAAEVKALLEATADRIGDDPYPGGRNDRYGHGRVNAARAVQAALSGPVPDGDAADGGPETRPPDDAGPVGRDLPGTDRAWAEVPSSDPVPTPDPDEPPPAGASGCAASAGRTLAIPWISLAILAFASLCRIRSKFPC